MTDLVTALAIKNAPAGSLRVEKGLRYKSNGNGTGNWQGRYTVGGKPETMSLGTFPEMSLKDARELNHENREKARDGISPKTERQNLVSANLSQPETFQQVTQIAYEDLKHTWRNQGARNGWWPKMEKYVFPEIGAKPISKVTGRVIADLVRPMWHDRHPTANKVLIGIGQVLGWAEASEYDCDGFAVKRARRILGKTRYKATNYAALDYQALPDYYAGLGEDMSDLGLRFYILTLPRTSNVTTATWDQIENGNVWHIPEGKMKTEAAHYVPLSDEALHVLDLAARFYDKREGYIFKNPHSWKTGHISGNNWSQQMRRHKLDATAHGMRATFKMWATFNKIDTDTVIEEVLHHKVRGEVEMAYMRGHTAELRRPIMKAWADYITKKTTLEDIKPNLRVVS